MNLLLSVATGQFLDASLGAYGQSERELLMQSLGRLQADDVLVLDRGYRAWWLFGALQREPEGSIHEPSAQSAQGPTQASGYRAPAAFAENTSQGQTVFPERQCQICCLILIGQVVLFLINNGIAAVATALGTLQAIISAIFPQ